MVPTRFLWPHKQDVTQVLAYAAQSCHDLVPPEHVTPLLLKVANNFVSDRSAPEVTLEFLNQINKKEKVVCVLRQPREFF